MSALLASLSGPQDPETAISPTNIGGALTLPPKGTQRVWDPTDRTAFSMDTRSLAIVISLTGAPNSPFSTSLPDAPTEKVPDTGFTPEWSPATSVT